MEAARTPSELIKDSRRFAEEDPWTTWRLFATTLLVTLSALAMTFVERIGPARWLASLLLGLVTVRWFIFYHDALHGAIFRRSRLGKSLLWIYGLIVLTPDRVWRDSHNYHHAHTSKLVGSSIGSFPILSRRMYLAATPKQRFLYRFTRHWGTILTGYLFIFLLGLCVKPLVINPRRNWEAGLSLVVHSAIVLALVYFFGWEQAALSFVFPMAVAFATGSYLFYAQHSFPDAELRGRAEWEFTAAALYSSSMIDMSPLMHWLTGNIGYHHVHHLNSMIPFYRLQEAMAAVPELRNPCRTSLKPRDVLECLRLHVWDPDLKRMITYRQARGPALTTAAD